MQVFNSDQSAIEGLMDRLQVPLWLLRANGTAVWLNHAARRVLELPDQSPAATVVGGLSDDVLATLEIVPEGRRVTGTVTFRGDSLESLVPCRLSRVNGPNGQGRPRSLVLAEAIFDLEARREVLRLTEQLAAISDAFPDLRLIVRRDGLVQDMTVTQPRFFGCSVESLIGRRIQEALPQPACDRMAEALQRVNQGEAAAEAAFTVSDGAMERRYDTRLVGLPDGVRVMAIVRDVTERFVAERDATRSYDRLMSIVGALPTAMAVLDSNDGLVVATPSFRALFEGRLRDGLSYEAILRCGVAVGLFPRAMADPEGFVAERLRRQADTHGSFDEPMSGGQWFRVSHQRSMNGAAVTVWAEISPWTVKTARHLGQDAPGPMR